jgi:hypothetical protein
VFDLPYDTVEGGETSSPHDVIEVVIHDRKQKTPADEAGVGLDTFQTTKVD